jgi:hypothetical protein
MRRGANTPAFEFSTICHLTRYRWQKSDLGGHDSSSTAVTISCEQSVKVCSMCCRKLKHKHEFTITG